MNGQPTPGGGGKKMNMLFISVVGVILLLASFLIGLATGMKSGGITPSGGACVESDFIARLQEQGIIPPDMGPNDPVYSLTGDIDRVGNDYFEVTAEISIFDNPGTYRVMVGPETDIILATYKSSDQLDAEMMAFEETMANYDPDTGEFPEPPAPFTEKKIGISDLSPGMRVNVNTDSDIRANPDFVATNVRINVPAPEPDEPEPPTEDLLMEELPAEESETP